MSDRPLGKDIKSMYRYAAQMRTNVTNIKVRRRIIIGIILLLVAITLIMSIAGGSAMAFRSNTKSLFTQKMANCVSSAIELVSRMESVTSSTTSQKLGYVRQYVYAMEQVNQMSISLYGEGNGRYAPDDAFTALYNDLDEYESLVQSAKTSTLDVRAQLMNHLTYLQGFISGQLIS